LTSPERANVSSPVIDVHTHSLTEAWFDLLKAHGGPRYTVQEVRGGMRAIHLDGAPFMTPVPAMFDYDLRIRTMDEVVSRSTANEDFNTLALTIFAGTALLLAVIGIFGLTSYSVEQRTQEIGIRLALGAQPRTVRNMVVLQGMRLAIIGVLIGVASAFGLTKLIASLLYGVQARDPVVFASVSMLLSAASFFAVWVPAQRATRVDPVDALRCE